MLRRILAWRYIIGVVLGIFLLRSQTPGQVRTGPLLIEETRTTVVGLPPVPFTALKRSASGDFYFMAGDRWSVHKVAQAGRQATAFNLHSVPEAAGGTVEMRDDLPIGADGSFLVPASWQPWSGSAVTTAMVFVFNPQGAYVRSIWIGRQMHVYRLAIEENGSFFAVTVDSAAARAGDPCRLVREYTASGRLVSAFSDCPAELARRRTPVDLPGPAYSRLLQDITRSQIWIEGGRLLHLLPVSRRLRTFDYSGTLFGEITLTPPGAVDVLRQYSLADGMGQDMIWRLIPLPEGRMLVEWLHEEVSGITRGRATYLALHGPDGRALTAGSAAPWKPSFPLFADPAGNCYFLRKPAGRPEELVQTRLTIP